MQNRFTRNVVNGGLYISRIYTTSLGKRSLAYSAPVTWNRFIEQNDNVKTITFTSPYNTILCFNINDNPDLNATNSTIGESCASE